MPTHPFSRTLSETSFNQPKVSHPKDNIWSATSTYNCLSTTNSEELSNPLLIFENSFPENKKQNNFKPNRSFTAGYNRSPEESMKDEIKIPFPEFKGNETKSYETLSSSFGELKMSGNNFPVGRSQSAIYFEQNSSHIQVPKQSSHILAIRRPPARLTQPKNMKQPLMDLDFSISTRSVPASRTTSKDFAELWKEIDSINGEKEIGDQGFSNPAKPQNHYSNMNGASDSKSNNVMVMNRQGDTFSNGVFNTIEAPFDPYLSNFDAPRSFVSQTEASYDKNTAQDWQGVEEKDHPKVLGYMDKPDFTSLGPKGSTGLPNQNRQLSDVRRNMTALPNRNVQCRYFKFGHCTRGKQCFYSHAYPVQSLNLQKMSPLIEDNFSYESTLIDHSHLNSPLSQSIDLNSLMSPEIKTYPKRMSESERTASLLNDPRFIDKELKDFIGHLYSLCLDQNGCRYLQKKIEEGNPNHINAICQELSPYFSQLLVNPFGNYLCQKLFEFTDSAQRVGLLKESLKDLHIIAQNMHGTRATQRMIEFLAYKDEDPEKAITLLTEAFKTHVVKLIHDINGNHVIQKCINLFSSKHNQFIFDEICKSCIEVSTHRHGCCVIQRCFDNASINQRDQLASEITRNALALVQDPFGNYVIQYLFDLNYSLYSAGLIKQFMGSLIQLAVQKFSSNVIEKCIRVAEDTIRYQLIQELTPSDYLEMLMLDSFANYVIQTCLDFAEPLQRDELITRIKPILVNIRSTPHIKRIQNRIINDDWNRDKRQNFMYDQPQRHNNNRARPTYNPSSNFFQPFSSPAPMFSRIKVYPNSNSASPGHHFNQDQPNLRRRS